MAANISNNAQRVDYARAERDDDSSQEEAAVADGQTAPQSETTIAAPTEQQSQSGDGGGSSSGNNDGTHEPSTPPQPPVESETLKPNFMRYGMGDTVIMGAPSYVRTYTDRAQPAGEPSMRETAFAPTPRAENMAPPLMSFSMPTLPPGISTTLPIPLGTTNSAANNTAPMQTAFAPHDMAASARIAADAIASTANTMVPATALAKPIPMPKPIGNMSSVPALMSPPLLSKPAPAPTHNAPQTGGGAATAPAPAATPTTPQPGSSDLAFERGMADLTLGDPLNIELIAHYEQTCPNASLVEHGNATADHLIATYGEARLNDMAKLHQALVGVRDDYTQALTAAEARGPSADHADFWKSPTGSSGDGGSEAPVFDNEAFTRWYVKQDGLSNRAFAANYAYDGVGTVMHSQGEGANPIETTLLSGGTSVIVHQRTETASEGGTSVHVPRFAAPGLFILGGPTCSIELKDPKAVWFDPTLGFVTRATNIVVNDGFFDKYMMVIIVTAVTAGAGAAGILPTAATFGGGTSGAILAGAANSVITSALVTVAQGGELTFKGLFQAALTGGIMGGLNSLSSYRTFTNLGLDTTTNTVTNYALRAVSITGQATLQGALRELVGGRFRDGFTEGLVQGLAGEITRALNNDIAGRVSRGEITAEQGRFLNEMSRATGSAIRAAANPNDPAFAFAQDYLTQLLGQGGVVPEVRGTALDDDGNVMPGAVDTTKPLEQQQQALRARLEEQGLSPAEVTRITQNYFTPQFMARDRFAGGVSTPVFDDNGALNVGVVDNRQTEAQQRQEIAARLIAQGIAPTEALRLANQVTLITTTPQEIRQNRIDALTRTHTQQGVTPERARQIAIGDVDGFGSESYLDATIDYSAANREALARMLGVSPDTIIDVASRPNEVTRIINEARRVRNILDDEAVQRFGNDPVALSAAFRQNDITATQYRALLIDVTFATPERMANAQTLVNRVLGFVQAGGGAALMTAGALATPSVVGTALGIASIGLGADQLAAGLNTMIDGVPVKTLLERGLIASGMNERQAALAAGIIALSPMALELALTNVSVRTVLSQRLGPILGTDKPEIVARLGTPAVTAGRLSGPAEQLTAEELAFVKEMVAGGRIVEIIPSSNAGRTADFLIDGTKYEFKTISGIANQTPNGISAAISSRIMDARGQSGNIIIDARGQPSMTLEIAERSAIRAFNADNRTGPRIQSITIITPTGTYYVPRIPK